MQREYRHSSFLFSFVLFSYPREFFCREKAALEFGNSHNSEGRALFLSFGCSCSFKRVRQTLLLFISLCPHSSRARIMGPLMEVHHRAWHSGLVRDPTWKNWSSWKPKYWGDCGEGEAPRMIQYSHLGTSGLTLNLHMHRFSPKILRTKLTE